MIGKQSSINVMLVTLVIAGITLVVLVIVNDLKQRYRRVRSSLKGQHVVITGGSSGIGKEIGILAAKRGAHVTIVARNRSKLESACKEIQTKAACPSNQRINYYKADVTNYEETEHAIHRSEIEVGLVDILFNCAGYAYPSKLEDIPLEHIKGMMDINYMGAVHVTRVVLPSMKSRKKGKITVVSSIAGLTGLYGYTAYSASKFALRGFAEALQMEVKPFNISITIAFPPDTDTPCLAEENKMKPMETKLIGDVAGVFQADKVALSIFEDTLAGDFFSTAGFDGTISTIVCAGMSPMSSILGLITQVLLQGPLRLVSLGYLYYFNRIVERCAAKKEMQKKSE